MLFRVLIFMFLSFLTVGLLVFLFDEYKFISCYIKKWNTYC